RLAAPPIRSGLSGVGRESLLGFPHLLSKLRVDLHAVRHLALPDAATAHACGGIGQGETAAHGVAAVAEKRRYDLPRVVPDERLVVGADPGITPGCPYWAIKDGFDDVGCGGGRNLHIFAFELLPAR